MELQASVAMQMWPATFRNCTQNRTAVCFRRFGTYWPISNTAWPLRAVPIGCPETSIRNYYSTLRRPKVKQTAQISFDGNYCLHLQSRERMFLRNVCIHEPYHRTKCRMCIFHKGKGKFCPRIGHKDPEGECMYSSNLSLTSSRPGRFTSGKEPVPSYKRLGGLQGRSERVRKVSPPPGFDSRTVLPVACRYTAWAIPAHI